MYIKAQKLLGVVVITWNNYQDTKNLLISLEKQIYKDFDVVVVDGKSTNFSIEKLKVEFTYPTYIQLNKDKGYSGSSNAGISYFLKSSYPYILILNNDVTLAEDAIKLLMEQIQKSGVAAVGPLTHSYYNKNLVQIGGSLVNIVSSTPISIWKKINELEDKYKTPYEVKKLPGACILFDAKVFEQIGMFDEMFFLYYGDTDFQKRLRGAGLKQILVPQARAIHKVSATTNTDISKFIYYETKGFLQYINKHYNFAVLVYSMINFYVSRVKAYLTAQIETKEKIAKVKYITKAVIDFIRNKRGKSL